MPLILQIIAVSPFVNVESQRRCETGLAIIQNPRLPHRSKFKINKGKNMSNDQKELQSENTPNQNGTWLAIGAGIGAALGIVFGNLPIGVALGVGIGIAIGAAHSQKNTKV
jgi:hypothetical protein